ncbi:hypothetical protein Tco_1528993, partial [Tanacetum coccineum]
LNDASFALSDLIRKESQDLAQKAKIKWAIEGDENSKFFHGSLKAKRHLLAIRGILKDDDWIEDPALVKNEFFNLFCNRFMLPPVEEDVARFVNEFFTFGFFPKGCNSSFITLIPKYRAVAFIKGRNILDGPFILNEVLEWYRNHKEGLMVFKFDFEKDFDSV